MNKNIIYAVIGVLVLIVVGFAVMNMKSRPEETIIPETVSSPVAMKQVTVNLAEQNDSGESGVAMLNEVDGKVVVSLNLTGFEAGIGQPAHIHQGACPQVGAVKYPLTSPVNGVSETTLNVTLDQLKSEMPLGINVHKSQTQAGVYVSCGDLVI